MYLSQEGDSSQESSKEPGKFQRRNAAIKADVNGILEGRFSQRVSLAGIVVLKEESDSVQGIFIDDGTGKILIKSFNNAPKFTGFNIGDSVLVIGSCREFNNEIYVAAEAAKNIDPLWIKVHQIELAKPDKAEEDCSSAKKMPINKDILSAIREFDDGNGALMSRLLELDCDGDIKLKIDFLLKKGEVFEVSPGRLKVLE